jgi:hypothetical protein
MPTVEAIPMSDSERNFEPGTVDESQHGWAPDAPGSTGAKDAAVEANRKAFEGRDTQPASRGDGDDDPDSAPEGVGESTSRRGEDIGASSEAGRQDTGTRGRSDRPVGESTDRDRTGVDPDRS